MRAWQINTYICSVAPEELTMCAICRLGNDGDCANCVSPFFETWCRETLFTLLCAQKRVGCVFHSLNMHIISIIYAFSISHMETLALCKAVLLRCGHKFHIHCMDKWSKRHHTCPLCNIGHEELYIEERVLQMRGSLVDCALYKEPFETRIKRKRREEHADAQITKLLKGGGFYTEDELVPLIQGNVKEALASLVEREFIVEEDGKYSYLP